ncbi:MAG: DUF2817 domain-containing protein [Candidatus Gastranaerophilaceae bacterium]|nr:DUF2817 domain-containing protein [Candidatus Gastranaerophilaceae bacterium]
MALTVLKSAFTKLGNEIQLIMSGNYLVSDRKALIIGVFHGDEPQGKYLIDKYLNNYVSNKLFIPCLNPDGMRLNQRTNSNGVDLNRNFPTKNWGEDTSAAGDNPENYYGGKMPASEIETKFIIDVIEEYKPDVILSLHAPYKVVNYDGPAKNIAKQISDIIGYPVEASIGYPTPGSFGTYCGVERNIPTITLELDEDIPVSELEASVFKIFDLI